MVSFSPDPIYLIRMGRVPYRQALRLMQRLAEARRLDRIEDTLLIVEHPPVITLGYGGGTEDVTAPRGRLAGLGIEVVQTERGGRATYHGPGQIVAYPILKLSDDDLHGYLGRIERAVVAALAKWGIEGELVDRHPGVWIGRDKIAAVGVAVGDRVTSHGVALNVDPDLSHYELLVPCGLADRGVTSMRAVLGHPLPLEAVERSLVAALGRELGRDIVLRGRPGPWLVAPAAQAETDGVAGLVEDLALHTVCQSAGCPNIGECWAHGTATFMLLGDLCTRHCRFCHVTAGRPGPLDLEEPRRVAEAAERLDLRHVVLTSVTRDDLPDGGAGHFAATILAIRERLPGASVEVLVPDFGGALGPLQTVIDARPDVFNHNIETVARLSDGVRSKASYRRSLAVLSWASRSGLVVKSGLMVGLGETCGEVLDAMRDLRRAGCDILTIGQYLQPSAGQMEVADHVHPEVFAWYRELGEALGFRAVASAPLVRSSYHAAEVWSARTAMVPLHSSFAEEV